MTAQGVRRADGVLAGHHLDGSGVGRALAEAREDRRSDELQDRRADRARDDVRRRDCRRDGIGVLGRVDRREAGHRHVAPAVADLVHHVAVGGVQRVDEGSGHVRERDLVAALVEEGADEAAADVAGAEVDRLLRHARPPFSRV
jgi:hypothetical protein